MATSSSAAPKLEWLVLVPDNTEPGTLDKRIKSRPDHLQNILPAHKQGLVPFGGAYLQEHPKEGDAPKMMGSAMIFVAASEKEVRERLASDVYTTSGVWDVEKAQVWPFRTALRSGLDS